MKICYLVSFMLIISNYSLLSFSGQGKGTNEDPYKITTIKQLQEVNDDLNAHYILTNDIDASETESWDKGMGFLPLGRNYDSAFTGVFDGKGFTINNLYIYRQRDFVGLFGATRGTAKLRNFGLKDFRITGIQYVGGICGYLTGDSIRNCFCTGTISAYFKAGGFAGITIMGSIKDCFHRGRVSIHESGIGGFSSENRGKIENCYSATILDSTFTSRGFCGTNSGSVISSFWDKDLAEGKNSKGGTGLTKAQMSSRGVFEASGWDFSNIWFIPTNGYPELRVIKSNILPEFSGKGQGTIDEPFQITNIKQFQEVVYNLNSNYIVTNDIDGSETEGWNNGYGFFPIGSIYNRFTGSINGFNHIISNIYINQSGDVNLPFYNLTIGVFGIMSENAMLKNINMDNIHITAIKIANTGGLCNTNYGMIENCNLTNMDIKIVNASLSEYMGGFCGINNGLIKNSNSSGKISYPSLSSGGFCGVNRGLIDSCSAKGTMDTCGASGGFCGINDSTIINCSAKVDIIGGSSEVGGFCSVNNNYISYCYSSGSVFGKDEVGGFCGKNLNILIRCNSSGSVTSYGEEVGGFCGGMSGQGKIKYCFTNSDVTGIKWVGGFVGNYKNTTNQSSKISECFSTGNVTGDYMVGGFSAFSTDTIENCYATGDVNGNNFSGGFCDSNHGYIINTYFCGNLKSKYSKGGFCYYSHSGLNAISNCFYDETISGKNCEYVSGRSTMEMKKELTYLHSSWDFHKIWCINEGISYPKLNAFDSCGVTSIDDYFDSKNENLEISPNPASDYIEISIQGEHTGSPLREISIYNAIGECVMAVEPIHEPIDRRRQLPQQRLDISQLPPGVYFFRIGDRVSKFIKAL